jgi:hypothetical protein
MEQKVLEVLIAETEKAKQSYIESLVAGGAKDFAEYKHLCGVIRGLAIAQIEAQDLLRKLKENDED